MVDTSDGLMEAVVVTAPGELEISRIPVPEPGRDEVLARVRSVSICGTDAHLINGDYPGFWPPAFPFTPGHEWAGEVVALGPGAEAYGFSVGDRVCGTSHNACGACQKCVEGHYNLCENYGVPGLHAQYGHNVTGVDATYAVHSVKCVFAIPDEMSYDVASIVDPASIALHVARRGGIQAGDTVAVTGAGAIGLLAAESARVCGAARVIVVGRGSRLEFADGWGYETVDTRATDDPAGEVRRLTGGRGADVVLECAGVPQTLQWAMAMLRRGGRCAMVGIPTQDVALSCQSLVLDELELVGSRASAGEMRRVLPFVADGRIRASELVTHTFALSEYHKALATFNDRASGAMKIVVNP
ncbi:zinc-binding dehydrogenase [Nocardioides sp. CFH 31398]|uniref:zinc-dependent alcohol dehydrogenase n=1 Tax=Nocardioides sp. CFH 31398 TaxID=2919579 RepID=UPI001F058F83|nr:zinc-binding dehydrogenase [Nocardioides sp. CFH 31398]MCH1867816.1 zinc-binding dehydrogenase [Nocardioides sp. CFH 31398]